MWLLVQKGDVPTHFRNWILGRQRIQGPLSFFVCYDWAVMLPTHYNAVIVSAMASQITSLTIVYSTVYSGGDQRKHQSSVSLAFVRGIDRSPVNSPNKGPVTRKMFPFDDVIMSPLTMILALLIKSTRIWKLDREDSILWLTDMRHAQYHMTGLYRRARSHYNTINFLQDNTHNKHLPVRSRYGWMSFVRSHSYLIVLSLSLLCCIQCTGQQ